MKRKIIRLIEDKTQRKKKIQHTQEGEERIFINEKTGEKYCRVWSDNHIIKEIEQGGLVACFEWQIRDEDDAGFFEVYKNDFGYVSEKIPFDFKTLKEIEKHILEEELGYEEDIEICIFYYNK